jgi:DNA-binding MarR family transcriptional regulator
MGFDPLVTHPGRLSILAVLAGEGGHALEFVRLRGRTRLTDGNLAAHAKRLRSGGLIRVEKQFEAGKPITRFRLTDSGRRALEEHVRRVTQVIAAPRGAAEALDPVKATASDASQVAMSAEEEWVD